MLIGGCELASRRGGTSDGEVARVVVRVVKLVVVIKVVRKVKR